MFTRRPLPPPSTIELPPEPLPPAPPAFLVRAVMWLRRKLLNLANAVTPAQVVAIETITAAGVSQCFAALGRFGIPDLLEEGPQTAAQLAGRAGLDPDALHRVLRAAASIDLLGMDHEGRFSQTRISRTLRSGTVDRLREFALYFASESNTAAWADVHESIRTGGGAFERVHGMNVWQWFDQYPDEREIFAHAMMGITTQDAPVIAKLYPFGEIGKLCDVAGGRGTLLSELLLRYPHLHGVLAENAGVLESARPLLEHRGVLARCELVPCNFFEKVPAGSDAYVLKNILHDWDDETCRLILRNVRAAMTPGQRLLVCEVLLEKNTPDPLGAMPDMQMMIACAGGRERSADEYRALFGATGFSLGRIFPFPTASVIEANAT